MDYRLFALTFDHTTNADLLHDLLPNFLAPIGFDSFEPTATGLNAYLPTAEVADTPEADLHTTITTAIAYATEIAPATVRYEELPFEAKNWNATWEAQWTEPYTIATPEHSLHIVPDGYLTERLPEADSRIVLSPHCSFGLGDHPTTAMILKQLIGRRHALARQHVLDMGCGTGVLALYALQCGATHAMAIDIDPWSTEATTQNAMLNGLSPRLDIRLGSIEQTEGCVAGEFDLILANIHRNILMEHLPRYATLLSQGGTLFLSGFYTTDAPTLIAEAEALGLTHIATHSQEGWEADGTWACVELQKH